MWTDGQTSERSDEGVIKKREGRGQIREGKDHFNLPFHLICVTEVEVESAAV